MGKCTSQKQYSRYQEYCCMQKVVKTVVKNAVTVVKMLLYILRKDVRYYGFLTRYAGIGVVRGADDQGAQKPLSEKRGGINRQPGGPGAPN